MLVQHLLSKSTLALALAIIPSWALAVDTPIYTLQGSGASSSYVGQVISTTGVVTKRNNNGFFIQDLSGDGNPATSDGIFVFNSTLPAAVGSWVRVTGTLLEFNTGAASNTATSTRPLTEIGSVSAVTELGTGYSVTPVDIALPLAAGQSLEPFEGMLVRLTGPLTVQQNYFQARYGQLTMGAGGRHETPTNRYRPGSPQALALSDLQARSRFLLDDGTSTQNANPTAYAAANGLPRAGDTVSSLTGVLDFGLATASNAGPGLYRLHPTQTPSFSATNPRPAAPDVGGNVRLASMNVLNFFTTFTNGNTADGQTGQGCSLGGVVAASNCRGANSLAEFERQRAKIVQALIGLKADAVGLMEIQNNGGVAAQNLVNALNAQLGAGSYAVVPEPSTGMGTDAIKVAMIYKPTRLSLAGAAQSDTDPINNRPTLAQTFQAPNGERLTLVVNHLKSKGSCPSSGADADQADGQSCWNATRLAQAQRLRSFVAQLQATNGSPDALLIGDFNAYGQEDPIYDLTSSGYVDQIGRFNTLGYSYVFDGEAGRLDHAIATPSMSSKVVNAAHWHIDADESLAQDYNLEFKQPACATCAPDPFDASVPNRASDHDPALVGVALYKRINGSAARDTLLGSPGDDIIKGGVGADVLSGGAGQNLYVYDTLRDAGDTITDFVPGKDKLDVRSLLSSLGFAGGDPVALGWVRFVSINGGTRVDVRSSGALRPLLSLNGVSSSALVSSRDLIAN